MKKALLVGLVFMTILTMLLVVQKERKRKINLAQSQPIVEQVKPEQVEPPKELTWDDALKSINQDELKKDLNYLASEELEGRMSGKKGNVVAAEFIKKKFESFGLETVYHKFPIRRLNPGPKNEAGDDFTQNIYAVIEGTDPILKNEIVVIGAHMDHIGYGPSMSRAPAQRRVHPGADDNASGTVALLELAQAFSMVKTKCKRTVVFQAYSAEEMGLIGSRYYCDNPLYPKNKPSINSHIFMLNMDMVGYLGKGDYFASFIEGDSSPDIGLIIGELNKKYNFAKSITSRGSGGSDHASFYNKRVPVAFLHTGGHPHYHTPNDTPDKINYDGLEQVAQYAFELAWRVVDSETNPKFNHAAFREMEYTHDHGHPELPFHHYHEEKRD
jgi:hypothetical protein